MKKENQIMDALLKEHAQNGAGNDESFLEKVETQLDEVDQGEERGNVVDFSQEKKEEKKGGLHSSSWGRSMNWGVGVAAALTIGVVSYYGWKQDRERDLAMNDEYNVPESQLPVSYQSSEDVPALDRKPKQEKAKVSVSRQKSSPKALRSPSAKVIAANTVSESNVPVPALEKEVEGGAGAAGGMADDVGVSDGFAVGMDFVAPRGLGAPRKERLRVSKKMKMDSKCGFVPPMHPIQPMHPIAEERRDVRSVVAGNRYGKLQDNAFQSPWKAPLSTFSIDVDTASYAQVRSLILSGRSVPADAVRIEEMVNYFHYDYPTPDYPTPTSESKGAHPFSVNVETASCPWNPEHRLVKIGLKAKEMIRAKRPSANLVFLLDVSGSMNNQDKLPLLVDSMKILLKELNGDDSVSIVVYAGAQGLALPPTHVDAEGRKTILKTLEDLQSGGSTNGGSGIKLAYKVAKKQFIKGGVNRVILGTDGDFNVGVTDNASLIRLVEQEAKSGVFLTVLGLGQGNLNDAMLEEITNKGNGNYAYIDNLREGRKVFLDDMMGTMVTIAKDVKVQVEFNPAKVKEYRLIGYANRMLKAEDFKNKRIDAGEIGAGHTVTALYEVIPVTDDNVGGGVKVDDLKYQKNKVSPPVNQREVVDSPEMLTVKIAYKQPDATKETESTYFNTPVIDSGKSWEEASDDFQFASGVALFGMLQRHSEYAGSGDYTIVKKLVESGRGKDECGLRTEFSDLLRKVMAQ